MYVRAGAGNQLFCLLENSLLTPTLLLSQSFTIMCTKELLQLENWRELLPLPTRTLEILVFPWYGLFSGDWLLPCFGVHALTTTVFHIAVPRTASFGSRS